MSSKNGALMNISEGNQNKLTECIPSIEFEIIVNNRKTKYINGYGTKTASYIP